MRDLSFEKDSYEIYSAARQRLIADPSPLIAVEEGVTSLVSGLLKAASNEIQEDYDAASKLFPFWRNYPPMERGRAPRGDQYPWIEVGEHSVGTKFSHLLRERVGIKDTGFPTGADQRFVITHESIGGMSGGHSLSAWLFLDIKSVGPRDDSDHAVMSHNQISGSGEWSSPDDGVRNATMTAVGSRATHPFYPALPPLVVLPDLSIAYVVTLAVKPVYRMEKIGNEWGGQPLGRIDLVTIPNGLLLTQNPNYLLRNPGLLYPGKVDKGKNPEKVRARVDFKLLSSIAEWRHRTVWELS